MVELALVIPILVLLLNAAVDFGYLYSERLEVSNATRVGVRWATTHPTSWSNNAAPADTTIEGEIIYAGDTRNIINDDTHIQIKYYDMTTPTAPVYCGTYQESTNTFVASGAYTQSNCVKPGNLITITVNYYYAPFTLGISQLFGTSILVTSTASMLEQV